MANDYFVHIGTQDRLQSGTKARADSVNSLLDKIEVGLNKLPSEAQLNRDTKNYIADSGTANAKAAALTHVTGAYEDGQKVILLVTTANTTEACTLNVNGIGAASIKYPDGNNPAIGDIIGMCEFRYAGSAWYLQSASVNSLSANAAYAASCANDAAATALDLVETAQDVIDTAASAAAAAASAAELQSQSALTYNATTTFDFNGNQTQVMATVTGDLTTLTTSNRAAGKSFTVLLISSGGDRAITYNASWRQIGYLPITITSGKALLITFVAIGSAETDVFIAGALEL